MAADLGYDYGPAPVVQVKIKCEHLFMRDWTARGPKAPMPMEVRKLPGRERPVAAGNAGRRREPRRVDPIAATDPAVRLTTR